jgi:hypothetical protein
MILDPAQVRVRSIVRLLSSIVWSKARNAGKPASYLINRHEQLDFGDWLTILDLLRLLAWQDGKWVLCLFPFSLSVISFDFPPFIYIVPVNPHPGCVARDNIINHFRIRCYLQVLISVNNGLVFPPKHLKKKDIEYPRNKLDLKIHNKFINDILKHHDIYSINKNLNKFNVSLSTVNVNIAAKMLERLERMSATVHNIMLNSR